MRYKIYYGANPTFTDADKRDFSRGGYECKALMKDRRNRPVVISQNKDSDFPVCCSAHMRKRWSSVVAASQDRGRHAEDQILSTHRL